jgi:hypothetical protein
MTDEEQVELGRAAGAMLANKAYAWAWKEIERVLTDQLAIYEIDRERAEYVRQLLASSRKYRQLLERAVKDGNFTAESIKQEKERRKFWQRNAA